jgi:hypothetical protein
MLLPSLPNLVSTTVEQVCPWEFTGAIPDNVRGPDNKKARTEWMSNPNTRHNAFCGWEGLTPSLRLTESATEGNPPYALRALIGDYESPVDGADLERGLQRIGGRTPPMWQARSLSGNSHFVWPLEKPLLVPSRAFAVALLEFVLKEMKLQYLAVGLDVPAFTSPERYYTNSLEWGQVSDYVLPHDLVSGWAMKVAEKFSFRSTGTTKIPLEVIWAELQTKYPGVEWHGDFVEGSQGPSFFIQGSTSPKSAIVKADGIYTFSGTATKPWWSWRDLLGASFVDNYQSRVLGSAVNDIFHDGQSYWRVTGRGKWRAYAKEDTVQHLRLAKGLDAQAPRGQPSEVERALEHIRHWNDIIGAAPFVFRPNGVINVEGGDRALNTCTLRAVEAATTSVEWGPSGQFPFLSEYLGGLFDPAEQLDYFLAWLQRFYKGAVNYQLESGQNIFFVGPTGVGKTLFGTKFIAKIVGGGTPAESYLMGKTDFNSELFEKAVWNVDDTSANDDMSAHRKFSTIVKRMAANTTFQYHAKFRVPLTVSWQGRVVVTANNDEESIRILPDLDISILDKIMIFRASDRKMAFGSNREVEATIDRELPFFARWLLDYTPKPECVGTSRFGITSYHEPTLVRMARQTSRLNSFHEIVEDWKSDYYAEHTDAWSGTAHQFLVELHRDPVKSAVLKGLTIDKVVMQLSALRRKGFDIEHDDNDGPLRRWTIPGPRLKRLPPSVNSPKYQR